MKFLDGLSLRGIKLLGIGIILVLISVGALLSVQPLVISINERSAEAAAIEERKAQIQSDLNRYSALQEFVPQMDSTTEYLSSKFPPLAATQDFIEEVYDAADATNIAANQIRGINSSTGTPIVATSGQSGEAICSSIEPGEFAKIFPDPQQNIKTPDGSKKHYIVCFEDEVVEIGRGAFYNSASANAARQCEFNTDVKEGTLFYLEATKCTEGNLIPALKAETITIEDDEDSYPTEDIIGEVATSISQIPFTILLDSNIQMQQLTAFVENIYRLDRAVSITSVTVGGGGNSGATVIKGYIYTHTKPISSSEFIEQQAASTEESSGEIEPNEETAAAEGEE